LIGPALLLAVYPLRVEAQIVGRTQKRSEQSAICAGESVTYGGKSAIHSEQPANSRLFLKLRRTPFGEYTLRKARSAFIAVQAGHSTNNRPVQHITATRPLYCLNYWLSRLRVSKAGRSLRGRLGN
jgi:hypothetical protein